MWQENLRQAVAGDVGAFDALVEHFQDSAVAMAFGILGDFEDAQDAAQETFIQAWRDLDSLRDLNSFPGWLMRIARNRCYDLQRRLRYCAVTTEAIVETACAGDTSDPLAEVSRLELRERVLAAVRALSEPNRLAATLFYIDGYSIDEVSQFLEVPAGTVKRRLHDARMRLKKGMIGMVRDALGESKPGPELRARVAAELRARLAQWDEMMRRWQTQAKVDQGRGENEWARQWHERRLEDVRANAAQYGIEPDEKLPRMLPEYQASETFRDDMMDIPRRWGVPEGLDLVNLRDLARETCLSPVAIRRWEDEGLPTIRYQPWVLYDRVRVREWLAAHRPEPAQTITSEQARKPLLVVLEALAAGLVTAEDAAGLFERLGAAVLLESHDPVWSAQWDAQHDRERQGNASRYGLSDPTGNWLGIPPDEEAGNVYEIRDLTRRLSVSPIDIVRWTHQGMPSLRWSPYVRWDVRHVTQWLTEQAILPTQCAMHELDLTAFFVCRAISVGEATADEGHEALSGWYGVT